MKGSLWLAKWRIFTFSLLPRKVFKGNSIYLLTTMNGGTNWPSKGHLPFHCYQEKVFKGKGIYLFTIMMGGTVIGQVKDTYLFTATKKSVQRKRYLPSCCCLGRHRDWLRSPCCCASLRLCVSTGCWLAEQTTEVKKMRPRSSHSCSMYWVLHTKSHTLQCGIIPYKFYSTTHYSALRCNAAEHNPEQYKVLC